MRLSALLEAAEGGLLPLSRPGADPLVTSVVTTDLLDPRRYLSGGELVLTGLAWWRPKRPARTRAFVRALTEAGVAALAAGEAGLDGVPDDLVAACDQAGLTLLRVPVDVAFATIIERAAQHLSTRRSDDVAAVLGRHRALVAAATRGSGALGQVLDLVRLDLDLHGWVLSPAGRLIAGDDPPEARERRLLAQRFLRAPSLPHRVTRRSGHRVSLFAAGNDSRLGSWLLAVPEDHTEWTDQRRAVVDELAQVVALERNLVRTESDDELAAALGGSSAVEVAGVLRRRGITADEPTVVVAALGPAAADVLAEALASVGPGSGWLGQLPTGDPGVLGLVRTDDPVPLVAQLRAVVDALQPGLGPEPLRIGVSDAVRGAAGLSGAAVEAMTAAAASSEPGARHTVAGPDRLVSHRTLLAAVPEQLREAYLDRILGALIEHDRQHRSQLVRTLAAYLACSGSWSRCAEMMHLHVNTLRYRIQRIEALTGRDLRRLDDQVDLLLALSLR